MGSDHFPTRLVIDVLDWVTGDPLRGVRVSSGDSPAAALAGCQSAQSLLTDELGQVRMIVPGGRLFVGILPDHVKDVLAIPGSEARLEFRCPATVRQFQY